MDRDNSQTYVREKSYSWISILAGLGGIWSFITGISICSLIELLYWLLFTIHNHKDAVKTEEQSSRSSSYQEDLEDDDPLKLKIPPSSQPSVILYDIQSDDEESLESYDQSYEKPKKVHKR